MEYRPRPTLRRLARQYLEYGRWRRQIMREHPETVSPRYLAPPAAVAGVVLGTAAGVVGTVGGPGWLRAGYLAPLGYGALLVGGSLSVAAGLPWSSRVRLPAVIATMHGAWGVGFLTSRDELGEEPAP